MSEVERITDLLTRAFEGGAFHGPAVKEILEGITAEQAKRRPILEAHTIWELVDHIAGWQEEVTHRLKGRAATLLPAEQNFPIHQDESENAWKQSLERLEESYRRLGAIIREFPESRLGEMVPGRKYTFYALMHGIVQHDLYHAGQIALLKKAG
jgi:uncharacterized damage-inducible protein DinB